MLKTKADVKKWMRRYVLLQTEVNNRSLTVINKNFKFSDTLGRRKRRNLFLHMLGYWPCYNKKKLTAFDL